jgi:hypothetical protein
VQRERKCGYNAIFLSLKAVFIFDVSSTILLFTVCCVLLAGGDSGELVAEGCILGTAHPPGYVRQERKSSSKFNN